MTKKDGYQTLPAGNADSGMEGTGADKGQKEKRNKDIYCKALANTLKCIRPPFTVGFYAPWGRRKTRLLNKVEGLLKESQIDSGTEKARGICSMLSLLLHIIFFQPLKPKEQARCRLQISGNRVRYVFIGFNAWEYVGCDYTWAGIVTTLVDEIEKHHKCCFAAFRYFGGDFQEKSNGDKWTLKRRSKILFGCLLSVCMLLIPLACLLSNVAAPTLAGSSLFIVLSPAVPILKNVLFTMKGNIQKQMNRKDLSTQLGFMHTVKNEVGTMIKFLKVLEHQEGNEIRVVLRITNLDLCARDKVVSVLDAIRILLSDPTAPFISILAADPSILVSCIEESSNTCRNGYLYLDRMVSLPFSLPLMILKEKKELLSEALKIQCQGECTTAEQRDMLSHVKVNKTAAVKGTYKGSFVESLGLTNNEIAGIRSSAFQLLEKSKYLPGNYVEMHQVVNTVLTIHYMLRLGYEFDQQLEGKSRETLEEDVIDWVILATSWPCRLSWLLQCEEDKRQRKTLGENGGAADDDKDKSLFKIYKENRPYLNKIKEKIKELLELDGDPDVFEEMLQKNEDNFTAERARFIPNILINLDFSLKRKFELLEDLHNTQGEKKCNLGPSDSPIGNLQLTSELQATHAWGGR